jgi:hypothetical protein
MNTTELLGQQVEVYHLIEDLLQDQVHKHLLYLQEVEPTIKATSFEYDGTSWTAGGNLNTAREALAGSGSGTQTSALAFGGGQEDQLLHLQKHMTAQLGQQMEV